MLLSPASSSDRLSIIAREAALDIADNYHISSWHSEGCSGCSE